MKTLGIMAAKYYKFAPIYSKLPKKMKAHEQDLTKHMGMTKKESKERKFY